MWPMGADPSCPIDRAKLLARFHAEEEGVVHNGAAAFAAMWRAIPLLRPLGLAARNGAVLAGAGGCVSSSFSRCVPGCNASSPEGLISRLPSRLASADLHRNERREETKPMTYFGAMQNEIYNAGLKGILPNWPVDFATLEKRAHGGFGAEPDELRRRRLRRRAYAGSECVGFPPLGHGAAHDGRLFRTRSVGRTVRTHLSHGRCSWPPSASTERLRRIATAIWRPRTPRR